jgi:predicted nucleic acid-binding Zn ribbon protein
MRTAGELIPLIFERFIKGDKKDDDYPAVSPLWAAITEKSGIPAAADHSRVLDLYQGVLQVETDHPGWLQIFQLKQKALLADVRARFPKLAVTGIAFRLSRGPLPKPDGEGFKDENR